ncbi:MAG TPA: UbiH/UbiF family hydroxylase [Afipia sp.]|uniref:UbiH/UbiF family hydroxylase n=1 Tax=unclassified Afipia TaxID=2642050 RepID=UPI0004662932|nr:MULTISPECIES: UbiH/UbiF family hydroxylase [unclassified Afipia]MAH70073.1 2-octaprenyl-6-methoxyphenyl hydroxylase [Afipia sp.]OUX60961.1 MAG: 2-octaprenyl-6-methoxyphenyl hydroxylase [Afipia sp. TMED4]HAO39527.1 UbiH/UbiF family hydroxylase [Afipia sp.]HAP10444.1 UbiH/UbiF family hydroxylase [Afipia sp.]HAP45911.1 UbiH/UbiF family hydroxylase [Afipia sp.]
MTENRTASQNYHTAVVGGGPAGLAAAIALAQAGVDTALIARRSPYADNRTTALLGGSVDFLQSLDVWRRCCDDAAALRTMRLVDDTRRLIRSPEVKFSSDEIGMEAFGYNIENRLLMVAMEARAAELPNLVRIDDEAETIATGVSSIAITTKQGQTLTAALVAGADGRHSLCREAAGIGVKRRDLGQSALTLNVTHTRPHGNCSTEFHTESGPCVFVPLPGERSSIVWVLKPDEAERLKSLDDQALAIAAEKQSHSILGKLTVAPGRHVFPLAIENPDHLAAKRIALVGEAAHVLPPIGAQGLNMGLRDAADLAEIVRDALLTGTDPGDDAVLQRYARARRADVFSRTFAVDMANRTLLSDFLPAQSLRAAGMHMLNSVGPLRRLAMREGLSPSWRGR